MPASIAVYWTFVSLIPVYNKLSIVFGRGCGVRLVFGSQSCLVLSMTSCRHFFDKTQYPYPIASAGIQLGIVATLLAIYNLVRHFWYVYVGCDSHRVGSGTNGVTVRHAQRSWLFGPGAWYKIKWTAPIGILFGLKYGVTNLGLALLPAPTHLLLQVRGKAGGRRGMPGV